MVPQFTNFICSTVLEKMVIFVLAWERWSGLCLSPGTEFANRILPNTLVHKPIYSANKSVPEQKYHHISNIFAI